MARYGPREKTTFPALGELEIEVMHDTFWPETLFISLLITSLNISPRQDLIQELETINTLFSAAKSSHICGLQSSGQSHTSSGHQITGSGSHTHPIQLHRNHPSQSHALI